MPADKKEKNLNNMKRFLRTISWNTVNLCFSYWTENDFCIVISKDAYVRAVSE